MNCHGRAIPTLLLVLACGGDATEETSSSTGVAATSDGSDSGDATSDEATDASSTETTEQDSTSAANDSSSGESGEACPPPPDLPPWLADQLDEVVAKLSGATEIEPGVTLPDRASASRRLTTANWLVDQLDAFGLDGQVHAYAADGNNVFATLPPTEPDAPFLVVGAHYDTVPESPGANDNATGVAMVLALARHLVELPCRRRGVVFVLFDQEEIGLVGSDAFAALLVDQELDVEAVHTIDQMGWDGDGDRAIELERPDAGLFEFWEAANATLPSPIPLWETRTGSTDHVSFRAYGFAAVGLTEEFVNGDTTPYYHLPGDTYDTVDLDFLESTSTLWLTAFVDVVAAR